jgi:hypothetical protein
VAILSRADKMAATNGARLIAVVALAGAGDLDPVQGAGNAGMFVWVSAGGLETEPAT